VKPLRISLQDGAELVIREPVVTDAPAMIDFLAVIGGESDFLTAGAGEFDISLKEEVDFIERARDADNALMLGAWLGDDLVGTGSFFGGARPRVRHMGELGVTVRRAHWGRGIGAALVDGLLDWARDNDVVTKINLRARADNTRAIQLYESRGFVIEGRVSREFRIDSVHFDAVYMGLEV